ncbi:hypothetical protein GOP47_0000772 [Adiantum capillus-veneris]|uniref:RING-type domain-containing protein n=1 Tax=Adiantum capillus-veneris TaxID=13818 RepID=A0A9D4VFL3_ADICA|nr:hypothetical protein GOP47_0000772 [Adiantum capillus-veneris]
MELLKCCGDCLITVWFVMGNMWAFGERPSSTCLALCRLVIVVLTLSLVRWAVPMIICSTLYCCMPTLIRALCTHDNDNDNIDDDDDFSYMHHLKMDRRAGASEATIHALPLHTHSTLSCSSAQPALSSNAKDNSCCCICLSRYKEGALVRELPCTHNFHMLCVDKWLRMSATCPLCKHDINHHSTDDLLML